MNAQIIIHDLEELKKYSQQLKQIKVFICATATGKTVLCNNSQKFFDLDRWGADLLHKGVPDFAERTIPKMHEEMGKGKVIINAFHSQFLNYLHQNNISFCTIFASPDQNEDYVQRMKERGSDQAFISKFGNSTAEKFCERMEDFRPKFKIILNSGEFVSDYLLKIFEVRNFKNIKTETFLNGEVYEK